LASCAIAQLASLTDSCSEAVEPVVRDKARESPGGTVSGHGTISGHARGGHQKFIIG